MIKSVNCGYVNAYLIIENEGVVLVDTGIKGSGKRILAAMEKEGRGPEDLRLIILTHGHSDHTGGLREIQALVDVPVLISGIEYDELLNGEVNFKPTGLLGKVSSRLMTLRAAAGVMPAVIEGDLILAEDMDLNAYGVQARVIPMPGHTRGSLAVVTGKGEALIGDTLMAMMPWDKPGKPIIAWDMTSVWESVERLLREGVRDFYLSHGGRVTRARIQGAIKGLEEAWYNPH